MDNGRDRPDEYEDQDSESTMMAPPGQRPSDTGRRDERAGGAAGTAGSGGGADSPDAVDADMEQEGDAKP